MLAELSMRLGFVVASEAANFCIFDKSLVSIEMLVNYVGVTF